MKRQAAILGPTPEFIRWSLRKCCPVRENSDFESADATERCLRSIREVEIAESENRIIEGIALQYFAGPSEHGPDQAGHHADDAAGSATINRGIIKLPGMPGDFESSSHEKLNSTNRDTHSLYGFFVEEVFRPFGSAEEVANTCRKCEANLLKLPGVNGIASCFGTLVRDQLGTLETINAAVVECFAHLSIATDFEKPNWFTLFGVEIQRLPLDQLECILERLYGNLEQPASLQSLLAAVKTSIQHQLKLDLTFHPAGVSDGVHWLIPPHCQICRGPHEVGQRFCRWCQKPGPPVAARKRKVLGMRPYIPLQQLVSPSMLLTLRDQLEQQTSK